jgi:hypothetical protein
VACWELLAGVGSRGELLWLAVPGPPAGRAMFPVVVQGTGGGVMFWPRSFRYGMVSAAETRAAHQDCNRGGAEGGEQGTGRAS